MVCLCNFFPKSIYELMQFVWRLLGVWHICQGCAALCTPAHDSHTCTVLPSALGCLSCATWPQHLTLALGQGAFFIIYYLYLCAYFVRARHPELGWQGSPRPTVFSKSEKQKSRLLILALPLFWSGCAHIEKWLHPLPCPQCHPTEPRHRAGGRRRTKTCTQVSQWHAIRLFWKHRSRSWSWQM